MIAYIILGITFLIDGILTNFIPYMEGDLSLFTPLITVVVIFLISPLFENKQKKYYITAFVCGLLYDLFYTDLLFVNAFLFLLIAICSIYVYKNQEIDYIRILIYLVLLIALYESSIALLIVIFNVVPMSFPKLFYKIGHSLLLNLIYGEVIYLIIANLPKKYKRRHLN